MDVLRDLPGLPGLFVACLFSGALRYQPDFVRTVPPIIIFNVFLDVDIDFLSLNGVQFILQHNLICLQLPGNSYHGGSDQTSRTTHDGGPCHPVIKNVG